MCERSETKDGLGVICPHARAEACCGQAVPLLLCASRPRGSVVVGVDAEAPTLDRPHRQPVGRPCGPGLRGQSRVVDELLACSARMHAAARRPGSIIEVWGRLNVHHVLPPWNGLASIVLVVNSFFTYAGIEVTAVHVDELRNPGREYPRAIFLAMGLVLAVFILPTLAIAWVIPSGQISLTAGVMQAFDSLLTHFGTSFAVPVIAIALAVGALAGMLAWLDGPSEGLLRIGREQGYLPPYFQKLNRQGIEVHILAAQGAVITIIALLYAFIPTISRAYWIFTAMATQVYLIMYLLMFIAAVRLRRAQPDRPRGYRAHWLGLLCLLGGVSSVTAFVIGFVPPSQLGHQSQLLYALLLVAGILVIGIVPPLLMDRLRKPGWKAAVASQPGSS